MLNGGPSGRRFYFKNSDKSFFTMKSLSALDDSQAKMFRDRTTAAPHSGLRNIAIFLQVCKHADTT
jgi:hypothetical protein